MYTQKPVNGRCRERAPYAALRQSQMPQSCCTSDAPAPVVCKLDPACPGGAPLAMVYAPCQAFENIYPPEQWLAKGTIFAALDFPFCGARRGR